MILRRVQFESSQNLLHAIIHLISIRFVWSFLAHFGRCLLVVDTTLSSARHIIYPLAMTPSFAQGQYLWTGADTELG